MNEPDVVLEDDIILAEEAPQQVRVAEGRGAQGEWVAWAGGNRKTVRIIAVDDDAFYAKAAPFDKAVALMKELRGGHPPSVVMAKGRKFSIDKLRDLRIEEKSGQIRIYNPLPFHRMPVWRHARFAVAVQHDLLDELSRRLPDVNRWHKKSSRLRGALIPFFCVVVFGLMAFGSWAMAKGWLDPDSTTTPFRDRAMEELIKTIGPNGVAVIGAAVVLANCIWLVRAVRNPPVEAGIKPKVNFWGKSKKQPTA